MSSITIQKILNDNGLGNRQDRWLALEKANTGKSLEFTAEQAAFLEKLNPCSRERHVESAVPGELLSADTFFVDSLKEWKGVPARGRGHLRLPRLRLCTSQSSPRPRWAVLHNDVLPFYRRRKLELKAVLTNNGREFCRT